MGRKRYDSKETSQPFGAPQSRHLPPSSSKILTLRADFGLAGIRWPKSLICRCKIFWLRFQLQRIQNVIILLTVAQINFNSPRCSSIDYPPSHCCMHIMKSQNVVRQRAVPGWVHVGCLWLQERLILLETRPSGIRPLFKAQPLLVCFLV